VFSWVRNITFLKNHPIQANGRRTVAVVTESLLEARGSRKFFNTVNSVNCLKELLPTWQCFMGMIINFLQNDQILVKGRSSVALLRESSMLEARGSITLFITVN
jgi:hypothetical protein